MAAYQLTPHGAIIRLADGASFLPAAGNVDYSRYLAEVESGAEVAPAPEPPAPGPTRDERLLAAVDKANAGVDAALDASSDFTARQKALLKGVLKGAFSGLGKAVSGAQP